MWNVNPTENYCGYSVSSFLLYKIKNGFYLHIHNRGLQTPQCTVTNLIGLCATFSVFIQVQMNLAKWGTVARHFLCCIVHLECIFLKMIAWTSWCLGQEYIQEMQHRWKLVLPMIKNVAFLSSLYFNLDGTFWKVLFALQIFLFLSDWRRQAGRFNSQRIR